MYITDKAGESKHTHMMSQKLHSIQIASMFQPGLYETPDEQGYNEFDGLQDETQVVDKTLIKNNRTVKKNALLNLLHNITVSAKQAITGNKHGKADLIGDPSKPLTREQLSKNERLSQDLAKRAGTESIGTSDVLSVQATKQALVKGGEAVVTKGGEVLSKEALLQQNLLKSGEQLKNGQVNLTVEGQLNGRMKLHGLDQIKNTAIEAIAHRAEASAQYQAALKASAMAAANPNMALAANGAEAAKFANAAEVAKASATTNAKMAADNMQLMNALKSQAAQLNAGGAETAAKIHAQSTQQAATQQAATQAASKGQGAAAREMAIKAQEEKDLVAAKMRMDNQPNPHDHRHHPL